MKHIRHIALFTAALLLPGGAAMAISLNQDVGRSVESIPSADQIQAFEALDTMHVRVTVADADYILTLKVACHQLSFAANVEVSMADNTIWADFDYVTADGWQCPIDSIRQVTPQELQRLKS